MKRSVLLIQTYPGRLLDPPTRVILVCPQVLGLKRVPAIFYTTGLHLGFL